MKQSKQKTKNTFIAVVILAIIVLAVGWLYLTSQKTTLEVVTDKPDYFAIDNPIVEIQLLNPRNADSGEVRVSYDENVLNLLSSANTAGVTMREVDNNLVFELSKEYFDTNNKVISALTFESVERSGTSIKFDRENSTLSSADGEMKVEVFKDAEFEVGQTPDRGERTTKGTTGEFDSL